MWYDNIWVYRHQQKRNAPGTRREEDDNIIEGTREDNTRGRVFLQREASTIKRYPAITNGDMLKKGVSPLPMATP